MAHTVAWLASDIFLSKQFVLCLKLFLYDGVTSNYTKLKAVAQVYIYFIKNAIILDVPVFQ